MWSLKMATYLTQMKPTEYAYIFKDLKNLYIPKKHSLPIAIAYICILYVNRLSCDKKKLEAKKFKLYSEESDFSRQNLLTEGDPLTVRVKIFIMVVDL